MPATSPLFGDKQTSVRDANAEQDGLVEQDGYRGGGQAERRQRPACADDRRWNSVTWAGRRLRSVRKCARRRSSNQAKVSGSSSAVRM
jgi:hypothetical protein